jgi:hypothetical protein
MANPFDPNAGTPVSKAEAMAWIEKYDQELRLDKNADTKSIFFGKDVLMQMVAGDSAGISFFLGLRYSDYAKKDVVNLILVPTTDDGTLLWEALHVSAKEDGNGAFDSGLPCPPYCPK